MSATMARERKSKAGQAKQTGNRHVEPRESFHLPQAMLDALTSYVERQRPATSKSAVIRLALEEFLTRQGMWSEDGTATPAEGGAE